MLDTGSNGPAFLRRTKAPSAKGYFLTDGAVKEVGFSDMGVTEAAGQLVSNASDLLLMLRALCGLRPSTLGAAFTEAMRPLGEGHDGMKIGYAVSLATSAQGKTIYVKTGETGGFSAVVAWQMEPPLGMVILANRGYLHELGKIGLALFDGLAGRLDSVQGTLAAKVEQAIAGFLAKIPGDRIPSWFAEAWKKAALAARPPLDPAAGDFSERLETAGFEALRARGWLNPRQWEGLEGWYRRFLHRQPDLAGFLHWAWDIRQPGFDPRTVRRAFLTAAQAELAATASGRRRAGAVTPTGATMGSSAGSATDSDPSPVLSPASADGGM